jgi:hypothetical protein
MGSSRDTRVAQGRPERTRTATIQTTVVVSIAEGGRHSNGVGGFSLIETLSQVYRTRRRER